MNSMLLFLSVPLPSCISFCFRPCAHRPSSFQHLFGLRSADEHRARFAHISSAGAAARLLPRASHSRIGWREAESDLSKNRIPYLSAIRYTNSNLFPAQRIAGK